jgi:hypothetical protein
MTPSQTAFRNSNFIFKSHSPSPSYRRSLMTSKYYSCSLTEIISTHCFGALMPNFQFEVLYKLTLQPEDLPDAVNDGIECGKSRYKPPNAL